MYLHKDLVDKATIRSKTNNKLTLATLEHGYFQNRNSDKIYIYIYKIQA